MPDDQLREFRRLEDGAARPTNGRARLVRIRDVEPHPSYSARNLEEWVGALAAHDLKPAFFHPDINVHYVDIHPKVRLDEDLGDLYAFTRSSHKSLRGRPFGASNPEVSSRRLAMLLMGRQFKHGWYCIKRTAQT